jgi:CheR methyltransferase, SAM binding domain
MQDADCVQFLRWALPRLELRWAGFRKGRRQVCRRISWRLAELGLSDGTAYRSYIEGNADEWDRLDGVSRITMSRFWRDPAVFESLRDDVLPALGPTVSLWSAGCASDEEPYSLVLAAAEGQPSGRSARTGVPLAHLRAARGADADGVASASRQRSPPPRARLALRAAPLPIHCRDDFHQPRRRTRNQPSSGISSPQPRPPGPMNRLRPCIGRRALHFRPGRAPSR